MDRALIQQLVRRRIKDRRLPLEALTACSTDHEAAACAVCGEPVMYYTTELEIGFQREGATSAVDSYRLHHFCFAACEMERPRTEGTAS